MRRELAARASPSGPTSGSPTSGSAPTASPASRSPSTSPTRASPASSRRRCSRSRAGRPSGACASCATRWATPSRTPTASGAGKRRIELFGKSSEKYPEYYAPRPYSKSFVVHLEAGYAQSHPDEDFAETFAVWLTPGSDWARRYADWKALRKLEYVDALMAGRGAAAPPAARRREVSRSPRSRKTLRQHYERAAAVLRGGRARALRPRPAAALLGRAGARAEPRRRHASCRASARRPAAASGAGPGSYQYLIDRVLGEMIARCRELNLRLASPEERGGAGLPRPPRGASWSTTSTAGASGWRYEGRGR